MRLGSLEFKAAWLQISDRDDSKWRKYKLSHAYAWDGEEFCEEVTVALVGLHIIHKTQSNPQWIWATFEHEDNSPTQAEVDHGQVENRYTFFNLDCEPQPINQGCLTQATAGCYPIAASAWTNAGLPPPTQTSCTANQTPSYCLDLSNPSCPPYPVQVTRVVPISNNGDNLVADLNAQMKEIIRKQASADSVWQHYQLIGTLWSGAPVGDNALDAKPPLTPLAQAGLRPVIEAVPLYNTTMETYAQQGAWAGASCNQNNSGKCTSVIRTSTTSSCQNCHAFAAIANAGATLPDGHTVLSYASDYSFVFQGAGPGKGN